MFADSDLRGTFPVWAHDWATPIISMAMLQAGTNQHLGPTRSVVCSLGLGPEDLHALCCRRRDAAMWTTAAFDGRR